MLEPAPSGDRAAFRMVLRATTRRMHRGSINGIGLVGPMSNFATPPQMVEEVSYRDMSEMPAFARKWRDRAPGAVVHRAQAVGVLLAREAGRL